MTKIILCITEGEKAEIRIIPELQKHFMTQDKLEIVSFSAEIYQFYRHIKDQNDDFLDTFAVLQQRHPSNPLLTQYTRQQIAEIYLFFDYDGHATRANNDDISDMLAYFNNETDMGKLYISYPMVEALKEPLTADIASIPKCSPISLGSAYKAAVNQQCNQDFHKLHNLTADDWRKQLILHLKTGHYLAKADYTFPNYETLINDLAQTNIFHHQKIKYITPHQSIAILSPFAFFILEYRGKVLLEEWKSL